MDKDYLKTLKYSELQKLAKKNGIRANQKADKLIAALNQKGATTTNKSVSPQKKRKSACKRDMTNVLTPQSQEETAAVQKPAHKVRLVTPRSLMTPKNTMRSNITPSSARVVNMPKSATPHPRKSIGATNSVRRQSVKSETPRSFAQKRKSKSVSRRTSPRIAAQETTKQDQSGEDKKVRRSTFEIKNDDATGTKNNDNAPAKVKEPAKANCNIPRFSAFLAEKKRATLATTSATKDWSKVHKRQFDKMESIDDYLARKRQRTDELTSSVKKAKTLTERTKNAVENLKAYRTPPASANKKRRLSKAAPVPPPSFQSPVFVPKVTSTKNMSVKFDKGTKSSSVFVFKGTSARKSLNASEARKSVGSALTPFKFKGTGNTNTPGPVSAKKATFDLKASLAKPLSYKPYTGKLSDNKKLNVEQAKENLKKPKVTSMAERRANAVKQRCVKKSNAINARRGIKV
ncbi:nucleolar and spindle-associated protein 1-like [Anneissia japonica]|uniref:nucleolar and spindle-associated protein 1-like n=1 Tax=Anneissia japonica TaxID=1529436 RepID=UPI0014257BBE|nr:nucleolar and spindle-associated protein 1-like [Anneissia japonica]